MIRLMRLFLVVFVSIVFSFAKAQNPVNAFAAVSSISGGTVLIVTSVNETYHTFEDGDYVIVMQMQDDVIGTNTTNISTFGDLGSIQSAGLYEVARILSHTESASLPNSITLYSPLMNTYNINSNASVQLITYRNMGANYTTSANIGTLPWNGTIGGVTAISVASVLTVGHSISANSAGFTFGLKNTPNGFTACNSTTYAVAIGTRFAGKGEGIYKRTNVAFAGARGKLLNGGGGGNDVNSGGGGGGNYSSGGSGGSGWTASGTGCSPIAGGLGGVSLSSSISGGRLFMGGGGGGGHENDNNGTVGGAGGGIIMIKAGTLTTISCTGISISATGSAAANASNDGAGGGGAGGSILFDVNTFSVAAACQLTVSGNGGNGGSSNASSSGAHGGGGGGGQGVVIYSSAQPTVNVTTVTIPGTGGVSCSGCPASVNGITGTGPSNAGVVSNISGPLPVELVSFTAKTNDLQQVNLVWGTAVEKNVKEFIIQRMSAEGRLTDIATVQARGNYSQYSVLDAWPEKGVSYYRLKELDLDGKAYLKPWVAVDLKTVGERMWVYPNPLPKGEKLISVYEGDPVSMVIEIIDPGGKLELQQTVNTFNTNLFTINTSQLNSGVYILRIKTEQGYSYKKLVVSE